MLHNAGKIDIHVHAVPKRDLPKPSGSNYPLPDELRSMYDRVGVDKAVLMPPGSAPEGTYDRMSQREAAQLFQAYPDVFIAWYCNIDPRQGSNGPDTDFSYYLSYYRSQGAAGVGEITANLYLDDPRMMNLFSHCERMHMPVLLHFGSMGNDYGVVDDVGFPRLEIVLKTFPKLIVIGHSPIFWASFQNDARGNPGAVFRLMASCENLWAEFSSISGGNAILQNPDFTYDFFAKFADRIMYGTDFHDPRNLETYDIYQKVCDFLDSSVKTGRLTMENYRKICRENALRLIRFGAEGTGNIL